jgi:hypothetical protein
VAEPAFFDKSFAGINCASGFIRFATDGTPSLVHTDVDTPCPATGRSRPIRAARGLAACPPAGGVFRGDDDAEAKVALLARSSAFGYATKLQQPQAVILKGGTAENGKSEILELARGVLPPSAICSLTAARMTDKRHIVGC